ncbi:hypothetical protein DYY88_23620 [Leptolyngbya iicbica LK]|uniref:GUN4-like domain-containing protein n=2 Tax=Leptolyngbya TaxID=47251 RepID=A0A4Q7E3M7_9CYAN|nr:hypothetical protein DYY88_23620 [Leptolyngbya sp. LK]
MSPRSKRSHWVNCELTRAIELDKPIFPLLLEGRQWLQVATKQSVDVIGGKLPEARFFDALRKCLPLPIETADALSVQEAANNKSSKFAGALLASHENLLTTNSTNFEDDLSSEKWIDYTRLRDLLKAGKWEEADQETFEVMLKAAGRAAEERQYLTGGQVRTFPCEDLLTIDRLWVHLSSGKFGFSVQKQIWIEMGGKLNSGENQDATIAIAAFQKMSDQTAWRVNGEPISYSQTIFDDSAPHGHLPHRWMFGWGDGGIRLLSSLIQPFPVS